MNLRKPWDCKLLTTAFLMFALLGIVSNAASVLAQTAADQSPEELAPVDMTGIWVPVITEDWRFRMMTAPIGDTASLPMSEEGQRVAAMWDPQADIAAGEECRAYGAAGIMRMPTRLSISWENPNTLLIETDAGQQQRQLHFNADETATMTASRQGYSVAWWEGFQEGQGQASAIPGNGDLSGAMAVTTNSLLPGYLRRNGVPYSADAVLEERFDILEGPHGVRWLVVLSKVIDPVYLDQPMWTSTHFKMEPDASKWNPTPCQIIMPTRDEEVTVD